MVLSIFFPVNVSCAQQLCKKMIVLPCQCHVWWHMKREQPWIVKGFRAEIVEFVVIIEDEIFWSLVADISGRRHKVKVKFNNAAIAHEPRFHASKRDISFQKWKCPISDFNKLVFPILRTSIILLSIIYVLNWNL